MLYLCHRNADPDALGSAIALAERYDGDIGVVGGCNKLAQAIARELGVSVLVDPNPEDYDLTVAVDASTHSQLNNIPIPRLAVIDHHSTARLAEQAIWHVVEEVDSTAEIVYRIAGVSTRRAGLALAAGIVTDTGHFKHASPGSFRAVADILEDAGVEYGEVLDLFSRVPEDMSRRIAMLKAASRMKIHRVNDWVVVTTSVGSFGGSAAASLTGLGADVAIVGSEKTGDKIRLSGRAKKNAVERGVNLGRVMARVGQQYNGSGGGHDAAAGLNARGKLDEALEDALEMVVEALVV